MPSSTETLAHRRSLSPEELEQVALADLRHWHSMPRDMRDNWRGEHSMDITYAVYQERDMVQRWLLLKAQVLEEKRKEQEGNRI